MADDDKKKPNGDSDIADAAAAAAGAAGAGGQAAGQDGPQVRLLAQYIKDLSFENPNAPGTFQGFSGNRPQINVDVNVEGQKGDNDQYEVLLKVSAEARHDDTTAFVVEIVYAGLFFLKNIPEQSIQPFLLVQAPTLLFPFARRVIADATRDGGYPPLLLDPIDFGMLYQQRAQQQQGGGAAPDLSAGGGSGQGAS